MNSHPWLLTREKREELKNTLILEQNYKRNQKLEDKKENKEKRHLRKAKKVEWDIEEAGFL